jgi:hypothetical protein
MRAQRRITAMASAHPTCVAAVLGGLLVVSSIAAVGCRRQFDDPDTEPPGVSMSCGIRGHMINADGTPWVHAKVVAVSLDRRSHISWLTDEMGRFALATDCHRLYTLAAQGPLDIAGAWIWVADAAVDVEASTPLQGPHLVVKPVAREDAARMRIFAIAPPTLTRPPAPNPDECALRADELQKIGDSARERDTKQLALVAKLDGYCGGCPEPQDAAALAGSLLAGRGIAEVWTNAYGRLFACTPGAHPHEAAFETVLGALHPEIAAMVVFGRIVEAEGRLDTTSAIRLWAKLRTGPLAETDFARNLRTIGEDGPTWP